MWWLSFNGPSAPQPRRTDDLGRDGWVNLDDLWWLSFNGPSAPQPRRTDDLGRDGLVDLEDLWWLSFNGPSVPRHRSRGGQTILDGMARSTLTTCGGFLLTVPQSLGIAAEEDRQSWAGWPGQP